MNVSHTRVSVANVYGTTCSTCSGCSHQNQKTQSVTNQKAKADLSSHCCVADSTGTR